MTEAESGIRRWIDEMGTIRLYEKSTNTFGAYNFDGSTKTFFKPSSDSYIERRSLDWGREIIDK
jgi:pyocin large subunit-like protein